jgi:hypothetical protein
MKNLLFVLFITPLSIWGQNNIIIGDFKSSDMMPSPFNFSQKTPICKTDSVRWITVSVIAKGDSLCKHSLIFSENYIPNGYYGCLVMHGEGCHCDKNDPYRKAICEKCGFHVEQHENTFQSQVKKEKSAYEKTVDLFKD